MGLGGCAAAILLAAVTVTVVWAFQDGTWIDDHGGVSGLFITVTLVLLGILIGSASIRVVARLATVIFRILTRRSPATAPPVATRWNAYEASVMLATCAFCSAGIVAGWSGNPTVTTLDSNGNRVLPGEVSRPVAGATDDELLTGFAPVLNLMLDEGRPPQRVDDYLAESTVLGLDGEILMQSPRVEDLAQIACDGDAAPCVVLDNAECPDSPACEPWELDDTLPGGVGIDEDVVGYGRVLRRSSDEVNWDASPFGQELTIIAQWWLFTPYDEWEAPVGWTHATLVKRHAADWEAVVMGFSEERPLFVAGTSHCGGTWRAFHEVRVDNFGYEPADLFGPRLHPSLGRARGAHAIYFDSYRGRSPDSLGCQSETRSDLFRIGAYALNIRDETSTAIPVLLTALSEAEASAVLEFPAYWSVENDAHLAVPTLFDMTKIRVAPRGSVSAPQGPSSPSTKPLYREPVTTIFCSDAWHYDGERSLDDPDCP